MADVYSSERVKLTIGDKLTLTGWDTITVSRNTENKTQQVAADGVVAKSSSADRTGTLTVSVQQQNSDFALAMSAYQAAIDANPEKDLTVSLALTDPSGGNSTVLKGVSLNKMPDQTSGAEAESREYMFMVDYVYYVPTPEGFDETNKTVANALAFRSTILSVIENL